MQKRHRNKLLCCFATLAGVTVMGSSRVHVKYNPCRKDSVVVRHWRVLRSWGPPVYTRALQMQLPFVMMSALCLSVLDCVQLRVGVCAAFAHLANEPASFAGLRCARRQERRPGWGSVGVTYIINPLLIALFGRAQAKKVKPSDFGSLAGTDCSQRLIAP